MLGVGLGLMISQLGNVIQSSVEESRRNEAGGLQFTGQQLGSALGVAFIGAIVLAGLTNTFTATRRTRPANQAQKWLQRLAIHHLSIRRMDNLMADQFIESDRPGQYIA